MPGYKPLLTVKIPNANVLIRLTYQDTQFLAERIQQALEKETGVNLVFVDWKGAISLTESDERGEQVKCIAFTRGTGVRVETEMEGYNGPWSHVELVYPKDSIAQFEEFLLDVGNLADQSPEEAITQSAAPPSWPPEDAGELLARWRATGSPEIQLGPGVSIVDLEKWFDPMMFPTPSEKDLDRVREVAGQAKLL